jgi:ergothioneine biosynthesis protein EgtB
MGRTDTTVGADPLLGSLAERFAQMRRCTEALCAPLEVEDYVVQSMPDASPAKWHLAHTTWFFETFVLPRAVPGYRPKNPAFNYLFNSYYNAIGERTPRPLRGTLSRPTVREVYEYREQVTDAVLEWLAGEGPESARGREITPLVVLGIHHEQQHQELILTDLKHAFASNPLRPAYRAAGDGVGPATASPARWVPYEGGLREIGHEGAGFAFDNETPRHRVFVEAFRIADRPVTNGEFLAFIEDGGYRRPELWLSDGWAACGSLGWTSPLYWEPDGGRWRVMTLAGPRALDEAEPVCHVSFYEAAAFACWAGARLPTEAEWEVVAAGQPAAGHFLEGGTYHPRPAPPVDGDGVVQLFGDVWEWTSSPYTPYPGYRPAAGALGEYNGKFMCNQMVLRGGSCATPRSHIRASYRNFFPPEARWQFSGLRLAQDG